MNGLGVLKREALQLGMALLLGMVLPLSTYAKELWLIGGGEPVCSSIEPDRCRPDARAEAERYFTRMEAVRVKSFRFSESQLQRLSALPRWFAVRADAKATDLAALADIVRPLQDKTLAEDSWHALLEPLKLSDDQLQLYDDAFEVRPLAKSGHTARMVTYLKGGEPYVEDMFRQFVAAAANNSLRRDKTAKPRIVVLTASSNNPYEYVDYYLSLFESVGAEAIWLPLEPALPRAGDCSQLNVLRFEWNGAFDRAARYPELAAYQLPLCLQPQKLLAIVDSADGFFVNGGDQSLTMRALQEPYGQFTAVARRLLDRVEAGVPLSGSSAGNAVQSGHPRKAYPMISGGRTSHALQHGALANEPNSPACDLHNRCSTAAADGQLTYRALGGLQLFTLGVSDTHFRERDREGRLLRLLLDTHTPFGFGVDEATALRVRFQDDDSASLSVLGAGGVWIVDTRQARVQRSETQWQVTHAVASRLLSGDTADWHDGTLSASLQCPANATVIGEQMPDPETYAEQDDWRWYRLPGATVKGCERADGSWRYIGLPLRLEVRLAH